MDRLPVELVRMERQEEYFDREEVLGRDASSVFPTEAKKAAALDPEALKAAIGGDRKFVSATELEEIKARRGLAVEDGTLAPSKPLAEVLREAKEKKEQEFQDVWRQMKQGKNRPLDEDELDFLDTVAKAAAEQERAVRHQEEQELAAFHEALRQQEEAKAAELASHAKPSAPTALAQKPHHPPQYKRPLVAIKPKAKPAIVVVRSSHAQQAAACSRAQQQPLQSVARSEDLEESRADPRAPGSNDGTEQQQEPSSKRQKTEPGGAEGQPGAGEAQQAQQHRLGSVALQEEVGLPGLLGGYGSGSEDSDS